MRRDYERERNRKGGGQVRDEKRSTSEYTAAYKVNRSDELLEFLLRKCNTSRNNVKSLLVRRQVLVNGSVVTQYNFALAKDDEVKISKKPVQGGVGGAAPRVATRTARTANKDETLRFSVKPIYEDDEFIVLDKPAGLLSVESDKDTVSAFSYVFAYLQRQNKAARPFVLHRIDKETSGVLIFAKDIKIHSMLKLRWNDLVQTREYYAVVEGVPEKREDTLVHYLKENKNNLMYATNDPSGQKAVTHYEVIKDNGEYALLRVRIDTGRKNQIRVQMKAVGHSVVGDEKYGCAKNPLGRLGLHASKLEFLHPKTEALMTFAATLPPSFRSLFQEQSR